jgi:hypothetical protein
MPACSICEKGEADAKVVNTLLHAKTKLRDIEADRRRLPKREPPRPT